MHKFAKNEKLEPISQCHNGNFWDSKWPKLMSHKISVAKNFLDFHIDTYSNLLHRINKKLHWKGFSSPLFFKETQTFLEYYLRTILWARTISLCTKSWFLSFSFLFAEICMHINAEIILKGYAQRWCLLMVKHYSDF